MLKGAILSEILLMHGYDSIEDVPYEELDAVLDEYGEAYAKTVGYRGIKKTKKESPYDY